MRYAARNEAVPQKLERSVRQLEKEKRVFRVVLAIMLSVRVTCTQIVSLTGRSRIQSLQMRM